MTLRKIVGQFLMSADQSSHQFVRLFEIGKFGLETEFNLDITGTFKTVILDVMANKNVKLPCDYISYKKIGLLNAKGEVVTLKRNDQLSKLQTNNTSGVKVTGTTEGLYSYNDLYYNNYFLNGTSWKLFGANSGTPNRGEYTVDKRNGVIRLDANFHGTQLVLEYLCDGYEEGEDDYFVDVRAAKCMMAYLRWQDAIDQRKKFSGGQVNAFMKDFYREKRLAKVRLNPFVLNEMAIATRIGTKLVAKA